MCPLTHVVSFNASVHHRKNCTTPKSRLWEARVLSQSKEPSSLKDKERGVFVKRMAGTTLVSWQIILNGASLHRIVTE